MAFAFIREFPIDGNDRSTRNYDAINERLVHAQAPDGLIIHYAGFDEDAGVFRIVNLWETREQGIKFFPRYCHTYGIRHPRMEYGLTYMDYSIWIN